MSDHRGPDPSKRAQASPAHGRPATEPGAVADALRFWRMVADGAAPEHPSRLVVRVLESIQRRVGAPR